MDIINQRVKLSYIFGGKKTTVKIKFLFLSENSLEYERSKSIEFTIVY